MVGSSFVTDTGTWHAPIERRLSKRRGGDADLEEKVHRLQAGTNGKAGKDKVTGYGQNQKQDAGNGDEKCKSKQGNMKREPSAIESEIHPSHKPAVYAPCISRLRRTRCRRKEANLWGDIHLSRSVS